jgi:pimeloyl-ACP methyl ester carboxylesterase
VLESANAYWSLAVFLYTIVPEADIYTARIPKRVTGLRIRGCDYAVNEWGAADAPLLFYLHGWGDCGSTIQFVVDSLQQQWHVVAPDWRGFGDTQTAVSGYWFPDYLADLDRLLDIYSPAAPVRLIGHSMGGNVAGLYAGSLPSRVTAFVNLEGFGLRDSDPAEAPARYRDWLRASRTLAGFATYPDLAALAAHIRRRNPRMTPDRALYAAACWGREVEGEVRLRADPVHKLPNPVLYRRAESEACWQRITAESLLVAGEDSEVRRLVSAGGLSLAAAVPIPGAETAVIENSGHMLHFDAPAEVAARIEPFLARTL